MLNTWYPSFPHVSPCLSSQTCIFLVLLHIDEQHTTFLSSSAQKLGADFCSSITFVSLFSCLIFMVFHMFSPGLILLYCRDHHPEIFCSVFNLSLWLPILFIEEKYFLNMFISSVTLCCLEEQLELFGLKYWTVNRLTYFINLGISPTFLVISSFPNFSRYINYSLCKGAQYSVWIHWFF